MTQTASFLDSTLLLVRTTQHSSSVQRTHYSRPDRLALDLDEQLTVIVRAQRFW